MGSNILFCKITTFHAKLKMALFFYQNKMKKNKLRKIPYIPLIDDEFLITVRYLYASS